MPSIQKSTLDKEVERRRKQLDRLPRLEYPGEYPGETIYISKRVYEGVMKKAVITGMRAVGGIGGKVIINYEPKKGKGSGTLELYDLGPSPQSK